MSREKRLCGRARHLHIDSLRKLKVMEHRILKEVPRSLVGLPDFKSGVGR